MSDSQLKFLYVAGTRAKKRLWIVDESNKGSPMQVSSVARSVFMPILILRSKSGEIEKRSRQIPGISIYRNLPQHPAAINGPSEAASSSRRSGISSRSRLSEWLVYHMKSP